MSSDATAVTTSRQPPATKKLFWKRFFVLLLTLSCLALATFISFSILGSVSGTELDALTWNSRSFRYVRIPFTSRQFSGIHHDRDFVVDPIVAPYLAGGTIAPPTARWDLATIYRGTALGLGPSRVLLEYLQALDTDAQPYWVKWTTNHPQAAAIFWPAVRDCVHLPRYDQLPRLFEAARAQRDPVKLQPLISSLVHDIALEEARQQKAAGDLPAAARAARLGLLYQPDSPELEQLTGSPSSPP